ncbi:MAG: hypothetical protein JXQ80_12985 [Bacteroidales bacterium]|nr:hypothetical protein [Bacteroidales bacterium]
MKTEPNNKGHLVMTAEPGYNFIRKHDQFLMGSEIVLGYDFSTGVMRLDLPEYYEEILVTEPEGELEEKVQGLEQTTADIIEVLNEKGLL